MPLPQVLPRPASSESEARRRSAPAAAEATVPGPTVHTERGRSAAGRTRGPVTVRTSPGPAD
eukprot:75835-Hanusia_phi.AAC.1